MDFEIAKPKYVFELDIKSRGYPIIRFRARCAGPFNELRTQVDGFDVVFRFSPSSCAIQVARIWSKVVFIVYVCDKQSDDDHTSQGYIDFFCELTIEQAFNILEKAMVCIEPYFVELE